MGGTIRGQNLYCYTTRSPNRGLGNVEHIAEEIADVQITLEQMIILHKCQGLVDKIRAEKVKRLRRRMAEHT